MTNIFIEIIQVKKHFNTTIYLKEGIVKSFFPIF